MFVEVYELGVETDINRVMFASSAPLSDAIKLDGSTKAATRLAAKLLPLSIAEQKPEKVPADAPLVSQLMQLKLLD